jgi:hypothetical protein
MLKWLYVHWPWAKTAWGWVVAVATILYALYQVPKPMFETFDWYMDRFQDYRVRDFLESKIQRGFNGLEKRYTKHGVLMSVAEISKGTGLKEAKVSGSLKRLKRKRDVSQVGNHWKIKTEDD